MTNFLEKMNEMEVTIDDLFMATDEVQKLPLEDRNWEGRAFTMARLFNGQPYKAMAIDSRLIAMSKMLEGGELPGWALPKQKDGSVAVAEPVWVAAATEPLILKENQATFDKEAFLNKVLASAEAEGNT